MRVDHRHRRQVPGLSSLLRVKRTGSLSECDVVGFRCVCVPKSQVREMQRSRKWKR